MLRTLTFTIAMILSAGTAPAWAWGCEGHQAIAIAAERMLPPATRVKMNAVLAASPIAATLRRFCDPVPASPLGDNATWADDFRDVDPATGVWHFINFPRGIGDNNADYRPSCKAPVSSTANNVGCIVNAILAQFRTLTTTGSPKPKANALRYIVHFVGDLHQPLHTVTNGDRGGNCFPIGTPDQAPQEDDRHNWRPNLHSVWDVELVRGLMQARHLAGPRELAASVAPPPATPIAAQVPTPVLVTAWARTTNAIARSVVYGKLPVNVPIDAAGSISLASCDDNNHVGARLAALNERLTPAYRQASEAVIASQLRLAAERLASVLRAAFPG